MYTIEAEYTKDISDIEKDSSEIEQKETQIYKLTLEKVSGEWKVNGHTLLF